MVVRRRDRAVLRQLRTLFDVGTIGELTDGQLLERFGTDPTEAAELAFAALVERHGPLVLRVCLFILRDEHAAEDAFQATFLVLFRKARSLWVRDSIAPWLHQVACRTAACARSAVVRRRRHEARYAGMAASRYGGDGTPRETDLHPLLHEEINRLPQKYRAPVVLCDLEGHTHEQAARSLGWPIGTIKTRLTHGRAMLRDRLIRRGLALSAALAAVESLTEIAKAALPSELARATVSAVMRLAGRQLAGVVVSAHVVTVSQGVLRAMLLTKLRLLVVATLLVGLGSIGAYTLVRGSQAKREDAAATHQDAPARLVNTSVPADEPLRLTLDEALLAAKAISDPSARRSALVRIANAQAYLGDRPSAQATLRVAHESAAKIVSELDKHFGLWRVARMQAQIGDVASARQTFDQLIRIADSRLLSGHVELLSYVAQAQAQAGLQPDARKTIKKALGVARGIEPDNLRNHGLRQILQAQMLAGDFDGALESADGLKDKQSPHRASFLQYIAGNCDSAGRAEAKLILTRALELSRGVIYPYPRAMAQSSVAQALARNGDITMALTTARAIGQPSGEDGDPGLLGRLFGGRERAARRERERVRGMAAGHEIAHALIVIAAEQAKGGDRAGSKATFREAFELIVNEREDVLKTQSLRILVQALAGNGEIEAAQEAIKALKNDEENKTLALVALARAQYKAGDKAGARDSLRAAQGEAGGIRRQETTINDDPARRKGESFQEVGIAQAEIGEIDDALATVAAHGDDNWKAGILSQIAPAQARAGDVAGAFKTVETIRNQEQKAEAFLRIAHFQAEAGKEKDALAWAAKLSSPQDRALALLGVVEGRIAARKGTAKKETSR